MPVLLLQRILRVRLAEVLKPALVPAAATLVMSAAVAGLAWNLDGVVSDLQLLSIAVPAGALAYVTAIALLSPELLRTAAGTIRIMVMPARLPER